MTKKKTIVGVEPAERTQTDGPEGLLSTLPNGDGCPRERECPAPAERCQARDAKGDAIRQCNHPATKQVTLFAEYFWVRVWLCDEHRRRP